LREQANRYAPRMNPNLTPCSQAPDPSERSKWVSVKVCFHLRCRFSHRDFPFPAVSHDVSSRHERRRT
jgi:hypothetical protein